MSLRARFLAALRAGDDGPHDDVSPSRLSTAATQVLGVSGAGLVMTQQLVRWPVGASGPAARRAEQIQATLNEGPCLTSAGEGQVVVADEDDLAARWPVYHRELVARTGFRSTMSFPLRQGPGAAFAALNLYSVGRVWEIEERPTAIADEIGDVIAMLLLLTSPSVETVRGQTVGVRTEDVPRPGTWPPPRDEVWIGVGMVAEVGGVAGVDALAILRGYAFAHDLLLDQVAGEMVGGRLSAATVLSAGPR